MNNLNVSLDLEIDADKFDLERAFRTENLLDLLTKEETSFNLSDAWFELAKSTLEFVQKKKNEEFDWDHCKLERIFNLLDSCRRNLKNDNNLSTRLDELIVNSFVQSNSEENSSNSVEKLEFFRFLVENRISTFPALNGEILQLISDSIESGNAKLSSKVIPLLFVGGFRLNSAEFGQLLRIIEEFREMIAELSGINENPSNLRRQEAFFLVVHSMVAKLDDKSEEFKEIRSVLLESVKLGLSASQSFVRKICRSALKSLTSSSSNREIWTTYLQFLDVLEQKQVHFIKPAFTTFDAVLLPFCLKSSKEGKCDFDVSWLLIIFRVGFAHLNGFVAKRFVRTYFQTSPRSFPEICGTNNQFLYECALFALNDADFYQRCVDGEFDQVGVDGLSAVLMDLSTFFDNFLLVNDGRELFSCLLKFYEARNWSSVPLFFLTHVLANLSNIRPVWTDDDFPRLRSAFYLLRQNSLPFLRTAIQENSLGLCLRLFDWRATNLRKFGENVLRFVPQTLFDVGSRFSRMAGELWTVSNEKLKYEELFSMRMDDEDAVYANVAVFSIKMKRKFVDDLVSLISESLNDVDTRPYLNYHQIDARLIVFTFMFKLVSPTEEFRNILNYSALNIDQVLKYLQLRTKHFKPSEMFFWNSMEILISFLCLNTKFQPQIESFKAKLSEQENKSEGEMLASFKLLTPISLRNVHLDVFDKDPKKISDHFNLEKSDRQPFLTFCQKTVWKLKFAVLSERKFQVENVDEAVLDILNLFDETDEECGLILLNCLNFMVDQVYVVDATLCTKILDRVGKVVKDSDSNIVLCQSLTTFVSIMLNCAIKVVDNEKSSNIRQIIEVCSQFLSDASSNHCLGETLARSFLEFARNEKKSAKFLTKHFQAIFVDFCLFGFSVRRDQRTFYVASSFLSSETKKYDSVNFVESDHVSAQKTRIFGLLCIFQCFNLIDGEKSDFIADLLKLTKEKLIECGEGTNRSKFYPLSICHRLRTRLVQLLFMLSFYVENENEAEDLLEFCRSILTSEGQHGSVRIFLEWSIISICLKFPNMSMKWLNCSEQMATERIGSLCSWLQICMHINLANPKKMFLEESILRIMPFCTAQNFTVRCCALAVLKRLWSTCKSLFQVSSFTRLVDSCVSFSAEHRNATKHVEKHLDDLYFKVFDVRRHLTLETIFEIYPEKCGLPDDEILTLNLFRRCGDENWEMVFDRFAVRNESDELRNGKSIIWQIGAKNQLAAEEDSKVATSVLQTKCDFDSDEFDKSLLELDTRKRFATKPNFDENQEKSLILVASLIERATNLGGLCRTCEIFGVDELVISNLKYLEDINFKNLSVSSESWVKIAEVKEDDLSVFLAEKRKRGYCIVGVEQTTQSADLRKFEFPKKTVLLLGNEREGIPPSMIQCLDFCVVIPQIGLIRSLNVHVAGALIVWEFAKQHKLKN